MTQQIKMTWNAMMRSRTAFLKNLTNSRTARSKRRKPVPMLSSASKCVWQMDREA